MCESSACDVALVREEELLSVGVVAALESVLSSFSGHTALRRRCSSVFFFFSSPEVIFLIALGFDLDDLFGLAGGDVAFALFGNFDGFLGVHGGDD